MAARLRPFLFGDERAATAAWVDQENRVLTNNIISLLLTTVLFCLYIISHQQRSCMGFVIMASKVSAPKLDIYDRLTAIIVEGLEGAQSPTEWPWIKAAQAGNPVNVVSKRGYRGLNRMVLGGMMAAGSDRHWGTYRQWESVGGQVRKGSKSTPVVYWGDLYVDANDNRVEKGTPGARRIVYAKAASVFSGDQVDGWTIPAEPIREANGAGSIEACEAFVAATGASVTERGDRAFYAIGLDTITMPERRRFKDTDTASATVHFYGTLLHELVHWTGAKPRCNREFGMRFGDEAYAFEELVAEIGSAFLSADLGISPTPRADNVGYLANWLKVLKGDKRAIFTASGAASKAADFLHAFQPDANDLADGEAEEMAEAA